MAAAELFLIVVKATPILMSILLGIVTNLVAFMGVLLPITINRAKKIPSHVNVILKVFRDQSLGSKDRRILATILIGISGILPFLTFSIIPFTGVPILGGLFVFPIACMLSFILVCLSYELVIIPVLKSKRANLSALIAETEEIKEDYLAIKNAVGPKWEKFVSATKKSLEKHAKEIEKIGKDIDSNFIIVCEKIVESIEPSIKELNIYLNSNEKITLSEEELNIIQEKIIAWKKITLSGTVSVGAGVATAAAAKSVFVPATFFNTITHSLGFGSGLLVSGGTYAAASVYAPFAIGGLAFYLSVKGLKKIEKDRLSDFLADVIIASLPMIYADGKADEKEMSAVYRMMANHAVNDKDRERIEKAINNPLDIEQIVSKHLMFEKNKEKSKIKSRLLLSMAWEIARSNGEIHQKEIEMHEKMARIFQVENNYCKEVRNLLTIAA